MKIYKNQWKSTQNNANPWKSMNMYEIYSFRKKKMGHFLYSKKINASHICPPKRNKSSNREMKIRVFQKTLTLTCKTQVKVMILMKTWNDPTVITDILPYTISHKPMIEVQFLTEVLKYISPKVRDSSPRQDFAIWLKSYGKFDENMIRTRLAWSQMSRKIKIFKQIVNLY